LCICRSIHQLSEYPGLLYIYTLRLVRILYRTWLGGRIGDFAALFARPPLLVIPEGIDGGLDLGAKIRTVEGGLVHNLLAVLAVPSQSVERILGPMLLENDADRIGEADGVVRGVGWQQEHLALADDNVAEFTIVDDLEQHGALVLVEPLGCFIYMIIGARVGAPDDLKSRISARSLSLTCGL
jgi:hypothetical protein